MSESPFRFYRGAAAIMASDLAETPRTGFRTQLCGDAHMLNFRLLASPERTVVRGFQTAARIGSSGRTGRADSDPRESVRTPFLSSTVALSEEESKRVTVISGATAPPIRQVSRRALARDRRTAVIRAGSTPSA